MSLDQTAGWMGSTAQSILGNYEGLNSEEVASGLSSQTNAEDGESE
jgi:hypothetical protein